MKGNEKFVHELGELGIDVKSPWDLVNSSIPYGQAIPSLVEWLDRAETEILPSEREKFREGIVRSLTTRQARGVAALSLLREFRRPDSSPEYRWAVGNALEVIADETILAPLVDISRDKQYGQARQMVVLGLGRITNPTAHKALLELLNDEVVAGQAIMALGRLRDAQSIPALEPFLNHPNPWIRKEAKKALAKISSARV